MKIVSVMACVGLLLSTVAVADTLPQTIPFDGTPNYTRTLTFDKFDDQGGTLVLESIEVIVELNVENGMLVLDNDGDEPAAGTFEFGAKGDINSTDVSLVDAALQPVTANLDATHSSPFSLAAQQGDGAEDFDPNGPDGMRYEGTPQTDSDSGFISDTVFAQYTLSDPNDATYDIMVDVDQWSDFGGISGIEWAVTPVVSSGEVTVIYTYTPEPTSLSLLLLGALSLLRRR